MNELRSRAFVAAVAALASIITVAVQFSFIYSRYGPHWVDGTEFTAFQQKLGWAATVPDRYRILSAFALDGVLHISPLGSQLGPAAEFEVVVWAFRLVQNFVDFLLAFWYLRTLRLSRRMSILGLVLMVYGMCAFGYGAGLSIGTYTTLALFMLAGVVINLHRDWWILPLTVIAALDSELAVFIPAMLFSARLAEMDWSKQSLARILSSRFVKPTAWSVMGCLIVLIGLRYFIGAAAYSTSRYGAVYPGLHLAALNATNPLTWIGLAEMYSLLPLTLVFFRRWPATLRFTLCFVAVPWFLGEFVFGSTSETRLFLIPLWVVFVPAALKLVSEDDVSSRGLHAAIAEVPAYRT